ncbi:membrane hypothetical protein [Microbacterium sp. 8M]|uniref:hypothetical protein n=1 Tax=Microbacterium sp. 8M TaxID=2653153 RepID=UPI0012F15AA5|nr:hypothetical protein [Microbacterium sp. 8M]VXB66566.1 membrane hypothetical protein [Microbacterium sp. 8M]
MTDRTPAAPSRTGSRRRRVLWLLLGAPALVLTIAGEWAPFLQVPLGEGMSGPISAYAAAVDPAILEGEGSQGPIIRAGFIGLLIVVALLVLTLLFAVGMRRMPRTVRGIGLLLGVLGVLGALAVLVLMGVGMRNVSAHPGSGGILLLVGATLATVVFAGAGRPRA